MRKGQIGLYEDDVIGILGNIAVTLRLNSRDVMSLLLTDLL
jgi:hypothetical protein